MADGRLTRGTPGAATYGTLLRLGSWWMLECEPHVLTMAKRVFGKVDKNAHGQFRLKRSPEVDRDLQWFLDRYPLEMSADDARALHVGAEAHREQVRTVARVLSGEYTPRTFDLAVPPRDYQRTAADLWLTARGLLLGDDLGVGKTASAITGLSDPATRPALCVLPTHLPHQWKKEILRFLPGTRVHIVKGTTPYDLADAMAKEDGGARTLPDVTLITYSKIAGWAASLAGKVRSVVFDEVQELRHAFAEPGRPTAKYAAAEHIAAQTPYRLGLSATPTHNFGGEFFNVLEILRPGALGTREEFARDWCIGGEERKRAVRDPLAFGLYLRESGLMLRRTRRDVGRELPPLTIVPYTIDADLAELDRVKGEAARLASIILAQSSGAGSGFTKLRAGGELDRLMRQATGVAKAPAAAAFLRMIVESDEPVIVGAWHRDVWNILAEQLEDVGFALYTGSESDKQKREALDRFVTGKAMVLGISLRSGGGIDGLQHRCCTAVIAELDWSPAPHDQLIGRVNRDGQQRACFGYYLLSDAGSDPTVADVCGAKKANTGPIRNPLEAMREQVTIDPDHVKKLAAACLRR
jgi:SNF2 family DNA or RNA helicase